MAEKIYKVKVTSPMGEQDGRLRMDVSGGSFTGSVSFMGREEDILDGVIDETGRISGHMRVKSPAGKLRAELSGTVTADAVEAELATKLGTFRLYTKGQEAPAAAERPAPPAPPRRKRGWAPISYQGIVLEEEPFLDGVIRPERDLCWHGGKAPNESWFIVANLKSGEDPISVQVHFQINDIPGMGAISPTSINVLHQAAGIYRSAEIIYSGDQVKVSEDRFEVRAEGLHFYGGTGEIHTKAELNGIAVELHSRRTAPLLRANGLGYVTFIGVPQYDFALPAMETTGRVSIDGTDYQVSGLSWFDRQWGELPASIDGANGLERIRWAWFNPQLSNGVNITVGEIINLEEDSILKFATVVKPDGTHILAPIEVIDEMEHWVSPSSGHRYPTRCIVRIPALDSELVIEAPYKSQEIPSQIPSLVKYEGATVITGTFEGKLVTGVGFAEYVGGWV